ncbi:MAG: hypothetical protein WC464_05650 [Bdellovibrionales bacterium]
MSKSAKVLIGAFIAILWPCFSVHAENPLSKVKVAVLYENVTDGSIIGRSKAETSAILKDIQAGFIFRGFWKWEPVVESSDHIPQALHAIIKEEGLQEAGGYDSKAVKNYRSLKEWIEGIKWENPSLIFCGALPAQRLMRIESDALTGRIFTGDETWALALDPQKWKTVIRGKAVTKEQLQARLAGVEAKTFDRRQTGVYFPDMTNPDYRFLLEGFAKKQIDAGADAVWIDGLLAQTKLFIEMTGDVRHPAVRESYLAAVKLVDDLHRYGAAKGKNILLGTWGQGEDDLSKLSPPLGLDFVTVSPSREDIEKGQLDVNKWLYKLAMINRNHGTVPILAFIDWDGEDSPLAAFSQRLSTEKQNKVLQTLDKDFSQVGVKFIYPVHGGFMGKNAKKRSFGKFLTYDSLAPQFGTFEAIKALAEEKTTAD